VTAINKAVSGIAEGNVSFQTMKEAGGNHIIVENPTMSELKSAKERVEIISTDTIDAFATLNGIQSIDIMKIDAEGYDDRVIDGAKSFFRKGLVKYVVCEYNQGDVCSEGCVDRLRKFGYAVYFMVRNKDLLVRSLDDYPFDKHKRSLNLLAVSPQIPISQIEENFNVQGRKLEKQA
jgi:FkbM family methyltransferase